MWIQMNSTDGLSHAIVNVECVDDSADISRAETVSSPIVCFNIIKSPEPWKCLCKLFIHRHLTTFLWHTILMAHINQ